MEVYTGGIHNTLEVYTVGIHYTLEVYTLHSRYTLYTVGIHYTLEVDIDIIGTYLFFLTKNSKLNDYFGKILPCFSLLYF